MGKRGAKPRFIDVYCPNQDCKLYVVAGKENMFRAAKQCEKVNEVLCKPGLDIDFSLRAPNLSLIFPLKSRSMARKLLNR